VISRHFIDRPILASVVSILITLGGYIGLQSLPLAMYPQIAPPTVQVDCRYPGASAQVVAETVASPIEQYVSGVEGMLYMSSQCTNDGSYNLTVTFRNGMDLNMAQVLVQNRVALALPMLPSVIKQAGVTTRKRSPDILLAVAFNSPDGIYDQFYLSNFANLKVRDEILRIPGVSDVLMLGQQDFSMRIWVDPDQLAHRGMTAYDVVNAIREQNNQVATGQIGQPPVLGDQSNQITIRTLGRLKNVDQFEEVIVKKGRDGRVVRLKDVATVEIGAKNQDISCRVNGLPSVSLAIFQLPDANALETARAVKARIAELEKDFPAGVRTEIRYDTTPFIEESIGEVYKTLAEAIVLVALVVLLFLQNWRSSIIPLVAVPVAIIGTFGVMAIMGFSINNLTLFGLVLAIGIVVDDSIVVVEAVEHHIENGLLPRDAAFRAMEEVSGPVIAIGLVLSAVFIPCAFISGIVGQFFRQFALTIACSTIISAINSLTLSPALAALLLKPRDEARPSAPLPRLAFVIGFAWLGFKLLGPQLAADLSLQRWASPQVILWTTVALTAIIGMALGQVFNAALGLFFRAFNLFFNLSSRIYTGTVWLLLKVSLVVLLGYVGLSFLTYKDFKATPKGFIPSQDMGYLLLNVQLPDAASLERTREVMRQVEQLCRQTPGVKHTQAIAGQSLLLSAFGSNFGSMFVMLDTFEHRRHPELYLDQLRIDPKTGLREPLETKDLTSDSIANKLRGKLAALVPEGEVQVLPPPPVRGVGRAGGYRLMVEDRGDSGPRYLQEAADELTGTFNDLLIDSAGNPVSGPSSGAKPGPAQKPGGTPQVGGAELRPTLTKALVSNSSVFRANVPQIFVDVNRKLAMQHGVDLKNLFDTLQIYLGSLYVNDINLYSRTWQVIVQARQARRNQIDDISRLKVRSRSGAMVPVAAVCTLKQQPGPLILTRYNMYPAAPINGSAAPGVSSGQAIQLVEQLSRQGLPESMAFEWTELAFLELQAGNTAMLVFGFAVVMVFLVLAAQYESWSLPLAVILVVPLCILASLQGIKMAGQDINIFTQVGFVVLVGLACKNAILIVEFARSKRQSGMPCQAAILEACRLRLRPIIMTSLAFILGVVPLTLAQGAGAEMRRTLGTTVLSGMLGVTLFGIFLTPVFVFVVDWLGSTLIFRSRLMRWFGRVTIGLFALGYARALSRYVIRSVYRADTTESATGNQPRKLVAQPEQTNSMSNEQS